jgi:hypothetical protein
MSLRARRSGGFYPPLPGEAIAALNRTQIASVQRAHLAMTFVAKGNDLDGHLAVFFF